MIYDYLIIGGGIAGTTAAETLRERDSRAIIGILEDEPYTLYSRVMIPGYLKNKIPRERLFLRKISDYESRHIYFHPKTSVVRVDLARHEVHSENGRVFSYKKLLIASGGKPRPFSAAKSKNMLRMHTLQDADLIKEATKKIPPKEAKETPDQPRLALVIGESFIAMEFLEIFSMNGFEVHAIARGSFFNERKFGESGGEILEKNFKRHKVNLHRKKDRLSVEEAVMPAFVGIGVGLSRNLEAFGNLEHRLGIVTDEFLRTSQPDVYAAGDIAEFYDVVAGRHRVAGNWTNAFLQGKLAALNMSADPAVAPFCAVTAYNIINFGLNLAFIGDLEDADDFFEYKSPEAHKPSFVRAFLKENKVKGAVVINKFNSVTALSRLIERGSTKDELEKIF